MKTAEILNAVKTSKNQVDEFKKKKTSTLKKKKVPLSTMSRFQKTFAVAKSWLP